MRDCFVDLCYKYEERSLDLLQFDFCSFGNRGICDGWEYGVFVNSHQIVEWHTPCGFGAADKAILKAQ